MFPMRTYLPVPRVCWSLLAESLLCLSCFFLLFLIYRNTRYHITVALNQITFTLIFPTILPLGCLAGSLLAGCCWSTWQAPTAPVDHTQGVVKCCYYAQRQTQHIALWCATGDAHLNIHREALASFCRAFNQKDNKSCICRVFQMLPWEDNCGDAETLCPGLKFR